MSELSEKAVRALTPKQQEVWVLCMRESKSQYRAARILGITRDAVKDRLTKAKKQFRKYINEQTRIEQNRKKQ